MSLQQMLFLEELLPKSLTTTVESSNARHRSWPPLDNRGDAIVGRTVIRESEEST
ncbi:MULTISPECIES: hypothetical protein [unclassified Mycobacterium]|uniref:hypothetical protein n=1 Tax=unclassified Mycobacterium TaxID=2642494 RepID=UPI0029C7C632|nr:MULTISPECIES: hypothetical protein [unclassified Mycobacterium]